MKRLADAMHAALHRFSPVRAAAVATGIPHGSRLRWLSRHWRDVLGWPGVAALGVLASILPFYLSAVRPLQAHLDEVRLSVERQAGQDALDGRAEEGARRGPAGQLAEYYRFFPPVRSAPQWLEKLVALAESRGLSLDQGEYHFEPDKVGQLVRFRMTLPVKGEYPQIRSFLADLQAGLPVVALEKVQFERQNIADPAVEARVGLVLYLGRPS